MADFLKNLAYLLAILPIFYGACAVVQLTVLRPKTRYVVIGSFATLAVLIGLMGLLLLIAPAVSSDAAQAQQNGRLYLVIAGVTILPLIKRVRLLLGRLTPVDPNSTVDISGVILALWILLISGATLLTVDMEAIASQVNITVGYSIISVIAYPALALCLVGIWVTRSPREAIKRLGLERLDARQIGISLGMVLPVLALGIGLDAIGRQLQPERYAQLESVLKAMSSNVTNPAVALILALCSGIGEEILFRGAIQPRLGIGLTALLFASLHTQYGATFAIVGVFLIGIILGYQRKYMNTTSTIITHSTYNFVAFLLAYLAGTSAGT
jgi:membrane protease YdiL (CAAX protease family)